MLAHIISRLHKLFIRPQIECTDDELCFVILICCPCINIITIIIHS